MIGAREEGRPRRMRARRLARRALAVLFVGAAIASVPAADARPRPELTGCKGECKKVERKCGGDCQKTHSGCARECGCPSGHACTEAQKKCFGLCNIRFEACFNGCRAGFQRCAQKC